MSLRCLAAFAILISVGSSRAADDPLDAFPTGTGVVLRLSPPAEISAKTKAFFQKAAPQFTAVADQITPGLGSLIGNPTLAGVDADRGWYVGVIPRAEQRPAVVFAAPASDAAALKKAVGAGYTFADFEDWVLYSLDAEAMTAVQTRISGEGSSVRDAMTESVRSVFAAGELAAFLNVPALREAYRVRIDEAKEQFLAGAEQAAESDPAIRAGMEYNRKAAEVLLKAIEDTSGVAAHLAIGENSIDAEAVAAVVPGSPSAAFLAKQTPSDFPLLAKLPHGRIAYYGLAGDFSELIAASARMSAGLGPQSEELRKRMEELQDFHYEEVVGLFDLGDLEGGVYRGISLVKVDEPQRYLEVVREIAKAMGHIETPGLQQDVTFQPEAETVAGVKVDVLKIVMTPDPKTDPSGAARKFLEVFFGEDGVTQRMAVVDGLFVQAAGEGTIEPAIKAARGEATGDETARKAAEATRAALGGTANLLVLYDLPRLLGGGLQLAVESKQLPLPIDPQAIENLNLAPSYTGVRVAAGKDEVRFRGVMPAEQVRGLVELFAVMQRVAPQPERQD